MALMLVSNSDLFAQQRGKKKKKSSKTDEYFDDSGGFAHRLWYGGGISLGFSGGTGESVFQFGLSPMVGYKITENFSVGPRVSAIYTNYRIQISNDQVAKADPLSWGVGAFARYKIIPIIFAHVEYGIEDEALFTNIVGNEIVVARRTRSNMFLGLGYSSNSGGPWGFEISILYNALLPDNSVESPFDLRTGFTYNF
ncbi:MAG: hypothetical protein DHS20C18_30870 [Saprospiraceae bacterium]|nr:MAG: hypothetical protein DHS20C18_30870 [Saprospiraceae bacterium]